MLNQELPRKIWFQTGTRLYDGSPLWASRLRTAEETKNLELVSNKYYEKPPKNEELFKSHS